MPEIPDYPPRSPQSLAAVAGLLLGERGREAILDLLVSLATTAIVGVDAASLSLKTSGRFETATATSDDVRQADEVQYATGSGPCVEAIDGGQAVNVELEATRESWPEFSDTTLALGYRAVLSTPMTSQRGGPGALNLYSRGAGSFDAIASHAAGAFADQVAAVLASTAGIGDAPTRSRQLAEALSTRDLISMAKGVLIAEQAVTADEAFDVLRHRAGQTDAKVRDVAAKMIQDHQARRRPPR